MRDLRPVVGSEQGGVRPVLIVQNDVGNRHSPTVICAAITSKTNKTKLPTHIELHAGQYDIVKDSVILLEAAPHHRQNPSEGQGLVIWTPPLMNRGQRGLLKSAWS